MVWVPAICGVDFVRSINKNTPYVMYFSIFKPLMGKFDPLYLMFY